MSGLFCFIKWAELLDGNASVLDLDIGPIGHFNPATAGYDPAIFGTTLYGYAAGRHRYRYGSHHSRGYDQPGEVIAKRITCVPITNRCRLVQSLKV